jgi:hypothetical protein
MLGVSSTLVEAPSVEKSCSEEQPERCRLQGGNNRSAALGFPDVAVLYTAGEVKNDKGFTKVDLFS